LLFLNGGYGTDFETFEFLNWVGYELDPFAVFISNLTNGVPLPKLNVWNEKDWIFGVNLILIFLGFNWWLIFEFGFLFVEAKVVNLFTFAKIFHP
jgi:hypothetical protein